MISRLFFQATFSTEVYSISVCGGDWMRFINKNSKLVSMIRQFHEIFVLNFWWDFTIWPNCALQHRTQSVGAAAKIIDRLWCAWFPLALSAQGRRQEPARPPERMRMWGLVLNMIIYVPIPIREEGGRLCAPHKLVFIKNFDIPADLMSRHAQC